MTKKYIKNFTAEYKTKVVLELLESEETISQLSKKYEITPKTIQNKRNLLRLRIKLIRCIHIFLRLIGKLPSKAVSLYMYQDQMKYGAVI